MTMEKITLSKKQEFITISKTAQRVVQECGLGGQKAYVEQVTDISGSMYDNFYYGHAQNASERTLALGCQFDDDGKIGMTMFGSRAHVMPELTTEDFEGYMNRHNIINRLEGSTNYATAMRVIIERHAPHLLQQKQPIVSGGGGILGGLKNLLFGSQPQQEQSEAIKKDLPVFVTFITDGDNHDEAETERLIKLSSKAGIFWQFVGIGRGSSFHFLKRLDELGGREIDNTGFFQLNDLGNINDEELYKRLINSGFKQWLPQARKMGLIL